MKKVVSEKFVRHGYRNEGIRPRLDKRETLKKKIRRRKAAERVGAYDPESDERFTFHQDDLRYRHIKKTSKESASAAIIFMMGARYLDEQQLINSALIPPLGLSPG